jgi:4'-phosphopantetheinyl transferase
MTAFVSRELPPVTVLPWPDRARDLVRAQARAQALALARARAGGTSGAGAGAAGLRAS